MEQDSGRIACRHGRLRHNLTMTSICIYLQVHQPYRVKRYSLFDIGNDHAYFNESGGNDLNNRRILRKVDDKSYRPTAELLMRLLNRHPEFKVALSFSGIVLEQLERDAPETLALFQEMVRTGRVEILGETHYHSLAFFYSRPEFEKQVEKHRTFVSRLFGATPRIFRNTELSYRNDLGTWADEHGYAGIITEGWDRVLGWRSPNYIYRPRGASSTRLLLKNYRFSDDVAFRFSSRDWSEWPLTTEKFGQWVSATPGDTINLFMDYETFGEHQWAESGIFEFMRALPGAALRRGVRFLTPGEAAANLVPSGAVELPQPLSWADRERDVSAWAGNAIQQDALRRVYDLAPVIRALPTGAAGARIREDWRRLQSSDHFYYMATKQWSDGEVHKYFSPYDSPYAAHVRWMNVMDDLEHRCARLRGTARADRAAHPAP